MPINRRDLLKITGAGGVALAGGSAAGATQKVAAVELTTSTSADSIGYAPAIVTPTSSMEADGGRSYSPEIRGIQLWYGASTCAGWESLRMSRCAVTRNRSSKPCSGPSTTVGESPYAAADTVMRTPVSRTTMAPSSIYHP